MKQKRLDFIVNAKGTPASLIANKKARIIRTLDSAVSNIEDAIEEKYSESETLVISFGEVASAGESDRLQEKFQTYLDVKADIRSLKEDLEELKILKKSLNEEIEIESAN